MRFLWVLFTICVVLSAVVLSEFGQVLLVLMMLSVIGIPQAFLLMYLPLFTGVLGIILFTGAVIARLPWFRKQGALVLFGLSVALAAGVLFAVPTFYNQKVEAAMPLAVAKDMPLSGTKAQGLVVGLNHRADRCSADCAELLFASPDIQLVLGRFDHLADGTSAAPPANSSTWGLVKRGVGLCPRPPNQSSSALHVAMAEAELDGFCFDQIPMTDHVDVVVRNINKPGDAPGQERDDKRTEMYLRQGDHLRLAYRVTTGSRYKLSVPLVFFSSNGHGFDLGLSLAPPKEKTLLKSPVAVLSTQALLEAALPGDITLPSFEAVRELSRKQQEALRKHERDIRKTLDRARYAAALTALRSDDAAEVAKGFKITNAYLSRFYTTGVSVSEIPLLLASVSTLRIPYFLDDHILPNSPPEVTMAVVDAVLDRLVEIGEAPLDKSTKSALRRILHQAKVRSQFDIRPRLERLDQLASTPRGRELVGGLIAMRGLLGPDQAPALLDYLDVQIADGKAGDGLDTAYRGLCLMGPEGVQFLGDFTQRDVQLGTTKHNSTVYDLSYNLTLMGLDDEKIRKTLRFELYSDAKRLERTEDLMIKARASAEKSLARETEKGISPPWRRLCK